MATPCEEFSISATRDALHLLIENRAWNRQLRLSGKLLVSSRLAQQIGASEYATARQLSNENVAECKRREIVLMGEVRIRESERVELRQFRNTFPRATEELLPTNRSLCSPLSSTDGREKA
jgi:hypothetical protein